MTLDPHHRAPPDPLLVDLVRALARAAAMRDNAAESEPGGDSRCQTRDAPRSMRDIRRTSSPTDRLTIRWLYAGDTLPTTD